MRMISVLALFVALTVTAAFGQATSGNINGTVVDSSGAALPNAQITITDEERGTVYHAQSNAEGNFSQTHLLAGRYKVTVENAGFSTVSINATVEIDATTPLAIKLTPGAMQTTIEVSDATPLLTRPRGNCRNAFREPSGGTTGPGQERNESTSAGAWNAA